jgi:hypothetical protein
MQILNEGKSEIITITTSSGADHKVIFNLDSYLIFILD